MKASDLVAGFRGGFFRDSLVSFGLKITSTGLAFIVGLLLARMLGAEGFGIYSYAISWVMLLSIFSGLGFRNVVVRGLASYSAHSSWGLARGLLVRSAQVVLVASVLLAAVAAIIVMVVYDNSGDAHKVRVILLALMLLPLLSLTTLRQSAMQGLGHVVSSQLPEMLIRPIVFLGLILVAYPLLHMSPSASSAMTMNVAATAVAFAVGTYMLGAVVPAEIKKAKPQSDMPTWMFSALPMLFVGGMQMINQQADIIILGILGSPDRVGIYAVAVRLANLIAFILIAMEIVVGPQIARLYATKDLDALQRLMRHSSRLIMAIAFPIAAVIIVFKGWLLSLFGPEFAAGGVPLIILAVGQIINASFGAIGRMALMTGHERATSVIVGGAAAVNVLLNFILIPLYGAVGAAIATTVTMTSWNVGLTYFLYKKTGILSTALDPRR